MQKIVETRDLPRPVATLLGILEPDDDDDSEEEPFSETVTVEEYSFNQQTYLIYRSYDLQKGKIEYGEHTGYVSVANDDKTLNLTADTKGKKISELMTLLIMHGNDCIAIYGQRFEASAETLRDHPTVIQILANLGIEVEELPTWQEVDEII